jgi:DNA-binding GntR family transcriptional regulator
MPDGVSTVGDGRPHDHAPPAGDSILDAFDLGGAISLRESAARMLTRAVIDGVLKPGDRISEADISRRMGISRGPLREALFQLERDGLIIHKNNRGAQVMNVETRDVYELYQARAAIERHAARLLAKDFTAEAEQTLRELATKLADPTTGSDELFTIDLKLHESMVRLTGNSRLVDMWRRIRNQILVCYSLTEMKSLLEDRKYSAHLAPEHNSLIDALRDGSDRAEKEVGAHIDASCERLIAVIAEKRADEVGSSSVDGSRRT